MVKPQHIAQLCALIPFLAVHLTWAINTSLALIPQCIPYIEGCTTISRAARSGESIHLFRALMLPTSSLLIAYWFLAHAWLLQLENTDTLGIKTMRILGISSAFFLILYATFLGTDGQFYRWMRRYGVTFFFSFNALAQIFLIHRLHQLRGPIIARELQTLLKVKTGLCIYQWTIGLISVPLGVMIVDKEARYIMQNIIEWHFAFSMNAFFLVTYFMFKKTKFRLTYRVTGT